MDQYLVLGNPIAHSKSPIIHAMFAEQTRQTLNYDRLLVPLNEFADMLDVLQEEDIKGVNVTVPFKIEALNYVLERFGKLACSKRAQKAGAVNTIFFTDDAGCFADNTDGIGLIRDVKNNLGWAIQDQKILVLGAGGATQGILLPLLQEKPKQLVIANRSVEKAQALAAQFSEDGPISAAAFEDLHEPFDLILNATSASLHQAELPLPKTILHEHTAVYDLGYGNEPTIFLQWAARNGCRKTADGLGMLVEQAAEAFFIWRNVRPETAPVIAALKK